MEYRIEQIRDADRHPVIDIFNYYIENSFAAFPETHVSYSFCDIFLKISEEYPVITVTSSTDAVCGFGMLRQYNPLPVFSRTAEIGYFIHPDFTGLGLGKMMLDYLLSEAKKCGIAEILAEISSLNERSIKFHRKNGFVECGRFLRIGKKKNLHFDVIWMQRSI